MLLPLLALSLPSADSVYLTTYFTGNGESGALFAVSDDGFDWRPLKEPNVAAVPAVVGASKLVRDPCYVEGPKGEWFMVWTSDWWGRDLGVSKLEGGKWGPPRLVAGIAPEGAKNTWAPEAVWDPQKKHYLLYWSSTVPGAFPETEVAGDDNNHRFYMATTKDFRTFTPTKLLWDPGFNVIDATILPFRGQWLMIAKDERKVPVAKKSLFVATAPSPEGPWTLGARDLAGKSWIEGPTAVDLGDRVRVYYDVYTAGKWGALESKDLKTWTDVSDRVRMVPHARHGTMHRVPKRFVESLAKAL